MSHSKELRSDSLDIKVHYQYHGGERCGLVSASFSSLYGMDFDAFISYLKDEVPYLTRLDTLRICFQDEEKTYIDMTPKNFHRFLRLSTFTYQSDIPKINIKVLEGASPAIIKKETEKPLGLSSRALNFDADEYKLTYKSPLELEMDLKRREILEKEKESSLLTKQFESMSREYNPTVYQDTSKNVCTKCHLRMGHTRNRCPMPNCETAAVCGQLDKHPAEKKELQDLGKRKLKAEGELKALRSELAVKETVSKDMSKSFEARIHDILIRTNPNKYLTAKNKPKEGIILADSYILKRYYNSKVPDNVERESDIWQTVIKSHEDNFEVNKMPKNSVIKELEKRGVNWPNKSSSSASYEISTNDSQSSSDIVPLVEDIAVRAGATNYNQMNWFTPQYYSGFGGYFPVHPYGFTQRAVSSPPPPPPPDE